MYVAEVESFTHKCRNHVIVSQKFLTPEDHVLIIDDFLANGCALQGLIQIVQSAGATVEGIGIAIEKRLSVGRKDHPQPRFSAWSLWQSLTEWMLRRNGDVSQPGRAKKRRSSPQKNVNSAGVRLLIKKKTGLCEGAAFLTWTDFFLTRKKL